jgi:hypothetical protein
MPSSRRARAERWVGRTLAGRYALGRVIGLGGHSAVFEATAVPDGARVAVKVLLLDEGTSPSVPERFLREAHTLGRVLHPNVVKVLDAGTDPLHGVAYIVQELLVGADLRTRLGSVGPLPPAAALAVVIPVARALEAAHAAGVVHRDLKPANVFLVRGADGAVLPKLIDFGIARRAEADEEPLTQDGALLGTPDYMSPEQARGRIDLDGRSDVWSLAVLLYETLAGRRPFTGPNYNAVILAIAHDDPPRLDALVEDLPPALVEAVHRALDKDPARRTATMEAFRLALERVASTLGPSAPHDTSEPTAEALLAGGPDTLDPARVGAVAAPLPMLGGALPPDGPDTLPPQQAVAFDGALPPTPRRIPWSTLGLVAGFVAVGAAAAWWGLRGVAAPPPEAPLLEGAPLNTTPVDAGAARARPTQPVAADLSLRTDLLGARTEGRLPERITVTQLRALMPPREAAVRRCVGPAWFGAVTVGFRATGDGVVREATVRGSLAGTAAAACIEAALKAESLPRFAARTQRFDWTWTLR